MRMLDRWAMDEKMFPEDPIGIEKQNGPFITYHSNGTKNIRDIWETNWKMDFYDKNGFITKRKNIKKSFKYDWFLV